MIDGVLRKMVASGLLSGSGRVSINASIRVDNVLLDVFDESGRHYYLRLAEAYDLENEFRIAVTVGRAIERFVPRALDFIRDGAVSCMVMEGVVCEAVSGSMVLEAASESTLAREVVAYFALARDRLAGGERGGVSGLVERLDRRYAGSEQGATWDRVKARVALSQLEGLPRQPQHGDFTPNNLGLQPDGLVIFDWEDYGKIELPGFDLGVLLAASVDFDPVTLRALRGELRNPASRRARWFDAACQSIGIDRHQLLDALPFYLFAFMLLKDRYSAEIRRKVLQSIEGLL